MLILPVSATGRQDRTPVIGNAASLILGSRASISAEISFSRSATPLTRVTLMALPQLFGNQVIETRCPATPPALQSPYIFLKKASFLRRPGSASTAGADGSPSG